MRGRRQKGANGEREVLTFLRDRLGDHLVRARGEGDNDHGDITGLPELTIQCKNWADVVAAVNEGLKGAAEQKANAGTLWGCAWIRRRGGRWFVAVDPEDFVSMYREATVGR